MLLVIALCRVVNTIHILVNPYGSSVYNRKSYANIVGYPLFICVGSLYMDDIRGKEGQGLRVKLTGTCRTKAIEMIIRCQHLHAYGRIGFLSNLPCGKTVIIVLLRHGET